MVLSPAPDQPPFPVALLHSPYGKRRRISQPENYQEVYAESYDDQLDATYNLSCQKASQYARAAYRKGIADKENDVLVQKLSSIRREARAKLKGVSGPAQRDIWKAAERDMRDLTITFKKSVTSGWPHEPTQQSVRKVFGGALKRPRLPDDGTTARLVKLLETCKVKDGSHKIANLDSSAWDRGFALQAAGATTNKLVSTDRTTEHVARDWTFKAILEVVSQDDRKEDGYTVAGLQARLDTCLKTSSLDDDKATVRARGTSIAERMQAAARILQKTEDNVEGMSAVERGLATAENTARQIIDIFSEEVAHDGGAEEVDLERQCAELRRGIEQRSDDDNDTVQDVLARALAEHEEALAFLQARPKRMMLRRFVTAQHDQYQQARRRRQREIEREAQKVNTVLDALAA